MRGNVRSFLLLFSFFFSLNTFADARLIIHLADYLANDYAGAVAEDGTVKSESEYAEQKEFSQKIMDEALINSKLKDNEEIQNSIKLLGELILKKSPPSVVTPLARSIQKAVLSQAGIALYPSAWPDYDKAKTLYETNCVQCHGKDGKGDGPLGKELDPAPANFHDVSRGLVVSPFAAFNTIRLGVPGTGMGAYDFSDDEVWSLAFYVNTFRFGSPQKSQSPLSSNASNEEILSQIASSNDQQFRSYALLVQENPETFLKKARLYQVEVQSADYLARAQTLLDDSVTAFENNDHEKAQQLSLEAYFQGFDLVESKISANDPAAVTRIEEQMANFRKAIKNKNGIEIKTHHQALSREISALQTLLSGQKITPTFAFLSGFSIILREGFEAVLVILAILGVAKAAASPSVTMAVHSGWIISLILGIIGWYLSGLLVTMSGVGRELLEGLAAFFAVFVLIYVGFWMHRQTEISRWKQFINVRVKNLTQTKNLLGLFALSFLVTFREVIETVLFLRTVYIDTAADSQVYIFLGVIVAFLIVLTVSILISKFRNKIPLQKFFNVSSILMMIIATFLTGKGVHALQEAAIFSMTPTPFKLRIELLGIFPSWESILAQILVLTVAFIIWKTAGKKK